MIREGLKVKGKVKFTLKNEQGVVKQVFVRNAVVDIGLDHIIERLATDATIAEFGSGYHGRHYDITALNDGTTLTVDGTQPSASNIIVTSNTGIDSNDLPLSLTGTGIPAETYITSLTGAARVNLNQSHSGVSDAATLQVGETDFTDIGASANTVGTSFGINFSTDSAGGIQLGHKYEIITVGTTDFTTLGADSNLAGTRFTSLSSNGTGTGTVYEIAAGTGTVNPSTMSHMALGSGSTAVSFADSGLETEIGRVALGTQNLLSPSLVFNANFGAGTATGAITEAGIFNADSDGDLLCRTTFAPINKGVSDILEVQWILTITRS